MSGPPSNLQRQWVSAAPAEAGLGHFLLGELITGRGNRGEWPQSRVGLGWHRTARRRTFSRKCGHACRRSQRLDLNWRCRVLDRAGPDFGQLERDRDALGPEPRSFVEDAGVAGQAGRIP